MLDALRALAPADLDVRTVHGRWPDVHARVEMADVAVCGHVVYNVADLGAFVTALTEHASRRVVLEFTEVHPQTTFVAAVASLLGHRPTDDADR